jgi:hypothetical protein
MNYTLTDNRKPLDGQYVMYGPNLDGGCTAIPPDPSNPLFQRYVAWLAAGNTPTPAAVPPPPVPTALLWQLEAACNGAVTSAAAGFTVPTWAQVQAAVAAESSPALTAFFNVGTNAIPASSTTLLALAAALPTPLTAAEVTALVAAAAQVSIP